jgi:hypothetical protein
VAKYWKEMATERNGGFIQVYMLGGEETLDVDLLVSPGHLS